MNFQKNVIQHFFAYRPICIPQFKSVRIFGLDLPQFMKQHGGKNVKNFIIASKILNEYGISMYYYGGDPIEISSDEESCIVRIQFGHMPLMHPQ